MLCTLVCASPFDAALHDAFGKVHGRSCYHTYGPDFLSHDLGHYLGPEFQSERLDRYISREAQAADAFHIISSGRLDPIETSDVTRPIGDGLPETLPEWIRFNGLTHIKIKLNGDDLRWDVERVLRIDNAAERTATRAACRSGFTRSISMSACTECRVSAGVPPPRPGANAGGVCAHSVHRAADGPRLEIEPGQLVMHEAAALRPVVIDESLIDLESPANRLHEDGGYTGAAAERRCKRDSRNRC